MISQPISISSLFVCLSILHSALAFSRKTQFCSEQFKACEPILEKREMIGSDSLSVMQLLWTLNTTESIKEACDGYKQFMHCAQRRIRRCVDGSRTLISVSRVLHLLCRNNVQVSRNQLMAHGGCINDVMEKVPSNKCQLRAHPSSHQVAKCREICGDNIECLVGVWISEQSLCALIDIKDQCGKEAAEFYLGFRKEVFNSFYPVLCFAQYTIGGGQIDSQTLQAIVSSHSRIQVEAASDMLIRRRQERSYNMLAGQYITPSSLPYASETLVPPMSVSPIGSELFAAKQRYQDTMRPIHALLNSWQNMPWYLASALPRPPSDRLTSPAASGETELYGAKVDRNFPLLIYTTLKDLMERYIHIYFNREYARA